MEVQSSKIKERTVYLSNPDQTIVLTHQNLDIERLRPKSTLLNLWRPVFIPAQEDQSEGIHKLIYCQRKLISVYSISGEEGIDLQWQCSLPDFSSKDEAQDMVQLRREFVFDAYCRRVLILTQKTDPGCRKYDFMELNLKALADHHLSILESKPVEMERSGQRKQVIFVGSASPRLYARNCILEVGGASTTQSFLSAGQSSSIMRPRVAFTRSNQNVEELFAAEMSKMTEAEIGLYEDIYDSFGSSISQHRRKIKGLKPFARFQDLNNRLYMVRFDHQRAVEIVKVFDKVNRKVLKVFSLAPFKNFL